MVGPDGEGNGPNDAHCQQQGKHEQDEPVHLPFHPAALAWGQRCIHHHLNTIHPMIFTPSLSMEVAQLHHAAEEKGYKKLPIKRNQA